MVTKQSGIKQAHPELRFFLLCVSVFLTDTTVILNNVPHVSLFGQCVRLLNETSSKRQDLLMQLTATAYAIRVIMVHSKLENLLLTPTEINDLNQPK